MPQNNFDDLLDSPIGEDEKAALKESKEGGPSETPEQARIKELEKQLAALTEAEVKVAEAAADEKTPEQKEQDHRAALAATASFNKAEPVFEAVNADDPDSLTFHILESGLSFAGTVWWVGQTVTLSKSGHAYADTKDRFGNSWLDDLSPEAQRKRFGKVMVGLGPWTGREFNDDVSKLDAKRGTAAPVTVLN